MAVYGRQWLAANCADCLLLPTLQARVMRCASTGYLTGQHRRIWGEQFCERRLCAGQASSARLYGLSNGSTGYINRRCKLGLTARPKQHCDECTITHGAITAMVASGMMTFWLLAYPCLQLSSAGFESHPILPQHGALSAATPDPSCCSPQQAVRLGMLLHLQDLLVLWQHNHRRLWCQPQGGDRSAGIQEPTDVLQPDITGHVCAVSRQPSCKKYPIHTGMCEWYKDHLRLAACQ